MSNELINYISRVTPATAALLVFFFAVPKREKLLRIFVYILLFILFRDAMTPEGLWRITPTLELRFISQPMTLWLLAGSSIFVVLLGHFFISPLNDLRIWVKGSVFNSVIFGLLGGVLIALLPFVFGIVTSRISSPKPEGAELIFAVGAIAYLGNFLEEVIFRGYFQGYLNELALSRWKIIFLSGGAFAICHSFLAYTVTSVGWPILLFTFYEGTICALLRDRRGLFSAVLAHGTGLFLILTH
jgi:uncharacterized protein